MLYLTIAVLLLLVLDVLTLVLVVGVIRRLRVHEARIPDLTGAPSPALEQLVLPVGATPTPFHATSVDGVAIAETDLRAGVVLAVVSPSCEPCHRLTDELAAGRAGAQGRRVVVVVCGTESESAPAVAQLRDAVEVVVESEGGPLQQALQVRGYPVVLAFDDTATVRWAGHGLEGLPAPAAAG